MILVTGATGMFGSRTAKELARRGVELRSLVRSPEGAEGLPGEIAVGNMDDAATLAEPMSGVETVFMIAPMDDRIAAREANMLAAAVEAGVRRIVKIHGAVRHRGDALERQHTAGIEAIKASGLSWALVSPNSVMETSLLGQAEAVKGTNAMWGCAGDGRVGLVAADDVARAAATVLAERDEDGRNYELTGPEAVSMAEIAETMSRVLGRRISYNDIPEAEFRKVLVEGSGMTPQEADIKVVLHLSAWRRGDADLVTDTYRELTGEDPTGLEDWVAAHREAFDPGGGESARAAGS